MIITLTLNPAIDKTAEIEPLKPGTVNRMDGARLDVGGKGINAARMINVIGGDCLSTGFVGGGMGDLFIRMLDEENIRHEFVKTASKTRVNLKLHDNVHGVTEINEPGIAVTEEEEQIIIEKLLGYANEKSVFILGGSMYRGADITLYAKLSQLLKEKGAIVFVDADNQAFVEALKGKPDFVKPNKEELLRYFGMDDVNPDDVSLETMIDLCCKIIDMGVGTIALSMGGDGAVFMNKDECFVAEGLKVQVESTVGAGDSMVGAMAYATDKGMSLKDAAILGVACSAAAVTTVGTSMPSIELINELKEKVIINAYKG